MAFVGCWAEPSWAHFGGASQRFAWGILRPLPSHLHQRLPRRPVNRSDAFSVVVCGLFLGYGLDFCLEAILAYCQFGLCFMPWTARISAGDCQPWEDCTKVDRLQQGQCGHLWSSASCWAWRCRRSGGELYYGGFVSHRWIFYTCAPHQARADQGFVFWVAGHYPFFVGEVYASVHHTVGKLEAALGHHQKLVCFQSRPPSFVTGDSRRGKQPHHLLVVYNPNKYDAATTAVELSRLLEPFKDKDGKFLEGQVLQFLSGFGGVVFFLDALGCFAKDLRHQPREASQKILQCLFFGAGLMHWSWRGVILLLFDGQSEKLRTLLTKRCDACAASPACRIHAGSRRSVLWEVEERLPGELHWADHPHDRLDLEATQSAEK